MIEALHAVEKAVRSRLEAKDGLLVIGLSGAQGSGKSTLAAELKSRFDGENMPTAILSIDDLYRTKAERNILGRTVHPLLRTRGVPGTHDVAMGLTIIAALERGEAVLLPRFDKAMDDRLPQGAWDRAEADTRILLLEGWCVGARPQPAEAVALPTNRLEREEDGQGVWRRYANDALAGEYLDLFARIDLLVMLAAPTFDIILQWRVQQERHLRAQRRGGMTDAQVERFVQHYERLTRWMLEEMPKRADISIALNTDRSVRAVSGLQD